MGAGGLGGDAGALDRRRPAYKTVSLVGAVRKGWRSGKSGAAASCAAYSSHGAGALSHCVQAVQG
eukprot:scaffold30500_cov67-Isochrysis_galbana.AAC.1